ncbi:MAG TPA: NAD-binding protein [Rhizomicrobium sp.]|jgi:hypothetical protein
MSWDLFRLKDWVLIGPVAIASLLLGLWGFLAAGHSLGDAIILTIGLIRGTGSYAFGQAPLQLVIAQYLLPATALFGGAKLLLVNFRRDMRVAMAHRARNHVIVCGLGETGMKIVGSMQRAGKPVVVVTIDGTGANALACERLAITVLNGDASQPGMLKLAGLPRADSVIVTTGSDSQNLEIGLSTSAFLASQARRDVKLLVEVRSDWVLDTLLDHRTAALGGAHVEFHLFNTTADAARLLLRTPAFLHLRQSSTNEHAPHIVFAGFGDINRELARRAICSNFALPDVRAVLSVLTRDVAEAESRLHGRDSALAAVAEFSFQSFAFGEDRADAWPDVHRLLSLRPADAVVVALDGDDTSLYTALQFRSCLDQLDQFTTPVFVRLKEQYKLGVFLQQVETQHLLENRLVPFGSLEQLTSPEILLGHELDRIARAGHDVYAGLAGRDDTSPASVPWERLAERYKESNRAQADHIAIAVGAIGYRIVPGAAKIELVPEELDSLAEIEHWRWCVERKAAGWTYGATRDDVLKLNPLLKPWGELSNSERNANRALASRIPEILARENFGLVKERNLTPEQLKTCSNVEPTGHPVLTVLRVDPLNDVELVEADAAAAADPATRVRLCWKGAGHLAEIERRLVHYPRLAHAVEGWIR